MRFTPARASIAQAGTATRVSPDVWIIPGTGMEWCDCGEDHELTRESIEERYGAVSDEDGVPHEAVVRVTADLWGYGRVCRFFHLKLEDAARTVAGAVKAKYQRNEAIDITGTFSKHWQGCPEEACDASPGVSPAGVDE